MKDTITDINTDFLQAWKNAIALIGYQYFGDGTQATCNLAKSVEVLHPRWRDIESAYPSMCEQDRLFLAYMMTSYKSPSHPKQRTFYLIKIDRKSIAKRSTIIDDKHHAALAALFDTNIEEIEAPIEVNK